MHVITLKNGIVVDSADELHWVHSRAFKYADGFFDTFIIESGVIRNLEYHIRRTLKSMFLLHLNVNKSNVLSVYQLITEFSNKNFSTSVRVRLQFWRCGHGLYTTSEQAWEWLAEIHPHERNLINILEKNVCISEHSYIHYNTYSCIKTTCALPYTQAGFEKRKKNCGELILLNSSGYIAECISANLFIHKENCWYTPDIRSGCIDGTMRQYILDAAFEKKIPVIETNIKVEDVLKALSAFSCNAAGITVFSTLENNTLDMEKAFNFLKQIFKLPISTS